MGPNREINKMKNLLIFSALIGVCLSANGQSRLMGTILDSEDGKPIPYVNIGIPGTSVGTASFENGAFEIVIPELHKKDSIWFSAIGYKPSRTLPGVIAPDGLPITIKLVRDVVVLKEVVVKVGKKVKPTQIGLSGKSFMAQQFSSREGGAAMAILLNEEGKSIDMLSSTIHISKNELSEFKLRCRLLEAENGYPGRDLLDQSVVVSSTIRKGSVTVDLSSYNLSVNKPFFLVFEWVMDRAMSDYYKRMQSRPAWLPAGSLIENRKTIVLLNEKREVVKKIPMTKEQREEYETIRMRYTEFSVRPTRFKCFARSSSMGKWVEVERDVICHVTGYTQ